MQDYFITPSFKTEEKRQAFFSQDLSPAEYLPGIILRLKRRSY